MKRNIFAVFIAINLGLILMMGAVGPQHSSKAQDDNTPTVVVHIVGANESLAQIAAQYGTTTDAIMATNSLNDARFIEAGQQLLIPNAQQIPSTAGFRHTVALGDTLAGIAARYAVPIQQLIAINHIVHPNRLYIGQPLIVGQIGQRQADYGYYTVTANDNAPRIAARFGMTLDELRQINRLAMPTVVFAGQRLLVRGLSEQPILPTPLTSLQLTPPNPVQGQSVSIQLTTNADATVSGQFLGRAISPVQQDDGIYYVVVGVHAFTATGVYNLDLRFNTTDGQTLRHDVRLWIGDGDYGSEAIDIPANRADLLEPTLVQRELDQVAAIMSGFNSIRYFNGLMALPANAPITSDYGTRRSYNGSPYNTFHGGTDFGGGVGAPIMAPANGMVVLAEPLVVRGNVVILDHGWGVYTGYWHLSEIGVQAGQQIQKGEVLGLLGATGLVTGAHLHWEMWVQGVQVDPMQWIQQPFP